MLFSCQVPLTIKLDIYILITSLPCLSSAMMTSPEVWPVKDINHNNTPRSTHTLVTSPRHWMLLVTSLVCAVLATLCKETGITSLGVCFLYDVMLNWRGVLRSVVCRHVKFSIKIGSDWPQMGLICDF